jgi:hypothetical protein
MIKTALVSVAIALLALGAGACGGARRASGLLMGDQDADNPHGGYYDSDDNGVRYQGHEASAADRQAITVLIKRYYAAAASDDGAGACALTYYIDIETIPEQYGQPPGPLWLRGAKTCPAVLSLVFKHFHSRLTAAIEVTGVRVSGDRADVLVGFRTLPAGVVKARREGHTWKIDGLLAVALP